MRGCGSDNEGMSADEVFELVAARPKGRTSFKTLARELGLKSERRAALAEALDQLVAEGRLIENRRGHYRTPTKQSGFVTGRFSLHPRGFGFVSSPRPIPGVEGDLYIGRGNSQNAMHGDRVTAEIIRIRHDGKAEGRVRRIVHREQQFVVGRFEYSKRGSWVDPQDQRVRGRIEILPGQEVPDQRALGERLGNVAPPSVASAQDLDGMVVTVEVTEFPTSSTPARGRVVEALGMPDEFGVDVETTIRMHHIPYRFSEEALAEAEEAPAEIGDAETKNRRDFRDLPIVTIDGETARDFDDAVLVEQLDSGNFALQVHIADVSHYVQPGSDLDREARERGNSTYFPDRAVPMLPERLSTGICSLNPDSDRLTMSALMEIDPRGEIVKAEFCRGVIRSAARMTYTSVQAVLDGDSETVEQYADLAPRFRLMQDLAKILITKRMRRGAIDLDLPEAVLELDEQGRMTGVKAAERLMSHRIIEEFMLAANEAVAERLESSGFTTLHRVHEPPASKALVDLEGTARQFGRSLGIETAPKTFSRSRRRRDGTKKLREVRADRDARIHSRDLQRFIVSLEGSPEARVLSQRVLRSMKQARYSEEASGHFALATGQYLHFTSPIRRYPDLVVHRTLGALLDGEKAPGPYSEAALASLADHTSMTERRSASAERDLLDWKRARFMEERLGDEFKALITSVGESGFWVELEELYIEGLVPIDSIEGDFFEYRERLRAIVGTRSKRRYGIGDRVRVRCDRVSFDQRRTEFSVLRTVDTIGLTTGRE